MSDEKKTHTQGEVDLLVAVAEVKTMQRVSMENFTAHTKEDDDHFKGLFDKLDNMPQKLMECSEKLKTDILTVSRREFTTVTDFQVFKTEVKTSVKIGVAVGTLAGTVIVTILYAVWALLKVGTVTP